MSLVNGMRIRKMRRPIWNSRYKLILLLKIICVAVNISMVNFYSFRTWFSGVRSILK